MMRSKVKRGLIAFLVVILSFIGILIRENCIDGKSIETNVMNKTVEIIFFSEQVYQQEIYILPEKVDINIDGKVIKDKVIWDKIAVTDTPGRYMYEGCTVGYNYHVNLILTVKENIYDRKVGYIRNIYFNENNEMVIEFDKVEFFQGEEALKEAMKESEVSIDDCVNFINLSGYYIRNSSYDKDVYKINKFPTFKLMEIEFNDEQKGALNLVKVDFDLMQRYINNYNNCDDEEKLLFCIDLKNNEVMSIVRQYLEYNY